MAGSMTAKVAPAPGGMIAPHGPGAIPDWTTVPTHVGETAPPAPAVVRPLSQYGTAEELIGVFTRKPMDELEPSDFEQAPAAPEEMRKAIPADLTPVRPLGALDRRLAVDAGEDAPALGTGE